MAELGILANLFVDENNFWCKTKVSQFELAIF